MTEGLAALGSKDYLDAQAAFRMAQQLKPESREPADGLLQVDQELRLGRITGLERQAQALESSEKWQSAIGAYEDILQLDGNLLFAKQGAARSTQMAALHQKLEDFIANPDGLSAPRQMQAATRLVVDITRVPDIGPQLAAQRDELTRLLKRAATPLPVRLISDNVTEVSIYKVARLGTFLEHQLKLRPGTYVAVGSRPGYRDVRVEFYVAAEVESGPVVIRCEEAI